MSKANRTIRDKALGGVNWWDYLNSIRPKGFRNDPQFIDKKDVIKGGKLIRIADKIVKKRKREEKKRLNMAKFAEKSNKITINKLHKIMVKPTKKAKADAIKYGLDLAKWWGEQHA